MDTNATQVEATKEVATGAAALLGKKLTKTGKERAAIRPIDDDLMAAALQNAINRKIGLTEFAREFSKAQGVNDKSVVQKYYGWRKDAKSKIESGDPEEIKMGQEVLARITFAGATQRIKGRKKVNITAKLSDIFAKLGDKPAQTSGVASSSSPMVEQHNGDSTITLPDGMVITVHQQPAKVSA